MTPQERYAAYDAANEALEREILIIHDAMKRMEKDALGYPFEYMPKAYRKFRTATLLMLSAVNKGLYAKVSFR